MSVQRCVYLEDDLVKIVISKKLPLSWFVNQALREYLIKLGLFCEDKDDRKR